MQKINLIAQGVLELSHREKSGRRRRQRRQPSGLNYSPRRKVLCRGKKISFAYCRRSVNATGFTKFGNRVTRNVSEIYVKIRAEGKAIEILSDVYAMIVMISKTHLPTTPNGSGLKESI